MIGGGGDRFIFNVEYVKYDKYGQFNYLCVYNSNTQIGSFTPHDIKLNKLKFPITCEYIELTDSGHIINNGEEELLNNGMYWIQFKPFIGFKDEFIKNYKQVKITEGKYSFMWNTDEELDFINDALTSLINTRLTNYTHDPNTKQLILEFIPR